MTLKLETPSHFNIVSELPVRVIGTHVKFRKAMNDTAGWVF